MFAGSQQHSEESGTGACLAAAMFCVVWLLCDEFRRLMNQMMQNMINHFVASERGIWYVKEMVEHEWVATRQCPEHRCQPALLRPERLLQRSKLCCSIARVVCKSRSPFNFYSRIWWGRLHIVLALCECARVLKLAGSSSSPDDAPALAASLTAGPGQYSATQFSKAFGITYFRRGFSCLGSFSVELF